MPITHRNAGFWRHFSPEHAHAPRAVKPCSIYLWLLALLVCIVSDATYARTPRHWQEPAGATISVAQLPPQAREVLRSIQLGGPFPYPQDGRVFENRERRLPTRPSGYYREYTVPTPGQRDRGARRIITGRNAELYYTDDHYRRFKRIVE
jgi:ribonuclease T1